MQTAALVVVACLLAACAVTERDGSGVPGGRRIGALSDVERERLCEWSTAQYGGERVVWCTDGSFVRTQSVEVCVSESHVYDPCAVSVASYEDCTRVMAEDPCRRDDPAPCHVLQSCELP